MAHGQMIQSNKTN